MNKLIKLSNGELENNLGLHIENERRSLEHIYEHINEVYRRDLHLDQAYGSMKIYLVKKWKYSERDAYRKIDGARLLKDVPSLAAEIKNGNVNADSIGELSRAVKEKERVTGEKISAVQKTELVALISGKTVAESQRELAKVLDIQVKEFDSKRVQRDNSVRLEISVSPEVYENITRCREHASHKIQLEKMTHSFDSILKILTDLYIKENGLNNNETRATDSPHETKSLKPTNKPNKTLTPKTRQAVLARDKCCQYKDPKTGKLCGSHYFAQVDHKISLWAGGNHELENLQQLCANHNRRKYRKEAQLTWM